MNGYLLAHDLGTSGDKATLYSADGALLGSELREYPVYYPQAGYVEQDPEDWWRAVCESTRALLARTGAKPADVLAVSFSGQMMGCALADGEGAPLGRALIWADTRAQRQQDFMIRAAGLEAGYRITGHRLSASYSAAKLIWVRDNEPERYRKAAFLFNAKDFLIYRLTGRAVTDFSDASGTNLFDIERLAWSEDLVKAFGIDPRLLPEAHPSADVAGRVTESAARETGLCAGTPVVIGGGDGSCACVGAGVAAEGKTYNVLGSSSWIATASRRPVFDPAMRTFNWVHLDPALYTPCGTMQAACVSYSWFCRELCEGEAAAASARGESVYQVVDRLAAAVPPGANGLLFLPYLLGERSPRWNFDARGAFVGLSASSTRAEMARAVLEGVGMNLRLILDAIGANSPIEEVRLIGGGAKGRAWAQILADIYQRPVLIPRYLDEATSMGAAVCAGVGVGAFENYRAVERLNPIEHIVPPRAELAPFYQKLRAAFEAAYEGLLPAYAALRQLAARPACEEEAK